MAQPVDLEGRKVAVIVADGFEQVEFDKPVQALRRAGAQVDVLAQDQAHMDHIRGVDHLEPAHGTSGDRLLEEVGVDDYDALLVPGGLVSPDTMRQSRAHLDLVRAFVEANKPTFVICHGPWLLADADVARDRTLTSWEGIRKDMERAGARWKDQSVVIDGNLITSRKPDDIPDFVNAILQRLANAPRQRTSA